MSFWQKRSSFDDVKDATKKVSDHAARYRVGNPYDEAEIGLGFMAFIVWMGQAFEPSTASDHLTYSNVSARATAVGLARAIYSRPPCVVDLKRRFPHFDAVEEISIAETPIGDADPRFAKWRISVTRGMILTCRFLSYDVCQDCGFITKILKSDGSLLRSLAGRSPAALIEPTRQWLKSSGLPNVGEFLSGLYLCPEAEATIETIFKSGTKFTGDAVTGLFTQGLG